MKSMKKANLFALVAALVCVTLCVGVGESGELGKYNVRISVANSDVFPPVLGLHVMRQYVDQKTNGNVKIEIFTNSQLGGEVESLQQVQTGTIEMCTSSFGPLATYNAGFSVMDIPFLFNNYPDAWMVMDSMVGANLLAQLEKDGFKGLAYTENGFRHTTNAIRPINTVEDFAGLKIRTMQTPLHMDNFRALGANPTPVPFTELYMAMSQRMVNGQENPIANVWELNMYEVQKYLSLTGHIYDALPLVANLRWYNSLPLEYQQVLSVGAQMAQSYGRYVNYLRESVMREKLAELGMEINEVSDEAKEKMRQASQAIVIEKVKEAAGADYVDKFLADIAAVKTDVTKGVK